MAAQLLFPLPQIFDLEIPAFDICNLLQVIVPPSLDHHKDIQCGIPFFHRDFWIKIIIGLIDFTFEFAAQSHIGGDAVALLPFFERSSHHGHRTIPVQRRPVRAAQRNGTAGKRPWISLKAGHFQSAIRHFFVTDKK